MDKLIITHGSPSALGSGQETAAPLLLTLHIKEGIPYRMHVDHREEEPQVGDIYRGRVQHVNAGAGNAFLELGDGRRGFMDLEEGEEAPRPGQEITVQIKQEGLGDKLPTVSSMLSLPGEWLVLTSEPGFLGFSRRASFEGPTREAIHEMLSPYFPRCGFIIRTQAEEASLSQLEEEAGELFQAYESLLLRGQHSPAPLKLSRGPAVYQEWAQGLDKGQGEIITDDRAVFEELTAYFARRGLDQSRLRLYQDESISLSALYHLEKAVREARERKIWLKSGAYLVIDRTEAMTVIDVNSGKNESPTRDTLARINQEAAREVARQLILRNLSGIILVDFINMRSGEDKEKLLSCMRDLVREDPGWTQVVDLTPLGLMEMTRRRIRRPLKI